MNLEEYILILYPPNDIAELAAGKERQQRRTKLCSCSHASYYMDKVASNYTDLGILWLEKRPLGIRYDRGVQKQEEWKS